MKYNFSLLLIPFLLISCSSPTSSSNEESFIESSLEQTSLFSSENSSDNSKEEETFLETRERLLNSLTVDNVDEINQEAVELGFYKPMYKGVSYTYKRYLSPFNNVSNDIDDYIFTTTYIKNADKDDVLNHHFTSIEDATDYLISLGYEIKDEITLPISVYNHIKPDLKICFNDYGFDQSLNRTLYKLNHNNEYVSDIVSSLTATNNRIFVMTINEGIYWKDYGGKPIRELNVDDIIRIVPSNDPLIFRMMKNDDYKITIITNEEKSLEEIKEYFSSSKFELICEKNEKLISGDNFSIREDDNGYSFTKNEKTINFTNRDLEEVDFDYKYGDYNDENCLREPSISNNGYLLNYKVGSDSYKKALNNVHFRKALLALFSYDDIDFMKALGNYIDRPYIKTEASDFLFDSLSPTRVESGLEEAKKEFALALEEGFDENDIDLHISGSSSSDRYKIISHYVNEVFEDRVKLYNDVSVDFTTSIFFSLNDESVVKMNNFYARTPSEAVSFIKMALEY